MTEPEPELLEQCPHCRAVVSARRCRVGRSLCPDCRGVLPSVTFGSVTYERAPLELDAYERIELAGAAWRNAYRAHERRDRPAVERHLREAIDHGIALIRGLYG